MAAVDPRESDLRQLDIARTVAEIQKLNAETRKLQLEITHYPVAVYLGAAGALAALIVLAAKLLS